MKITQILETTTSGSVATVSSPLGATQTRGQSIYGDQKVGSLLKGKKTSKTYANSITEGAMKQLSMDFKELTDAEFLAKYKKTKQEARKALREKPSQVDEAKLDEEDLILVPGQGHKLKPGFISKTNDRTDREVEMAISDLIQSAKNAETIHDILQNVSEDDGLEGWVQEKIIKAADYLNSVAEYLEGKQAQAESTAGTIAGGIAAEGELDEVGIPFRGVGGSFNRGDDERHDLDVPRAQTWYLRINGKVWKKAGQPVSFPSKEHARKAAGTVNARIKERNPSSTPDIIMTMNPSDSAVAEGAKVDRMVKHIAQSEKKLGHSKKEAENIAWATANKRGMLNNKNKKA